MINFSGKFVDYSVTGGFFLSLSLCFLWILSPDTIQLGSDRIISTAQLLDQSLPSYLETALSTIIVAVGLLIIFFSGYLLDIVGSTLVAYEIIIFRNHLEDNKIWISRFIDKHSEFAENDYIYLTSRYLTRTSEDHHEVINYFETLLQKITFGKLDLHIIKYGKDTVHKRSMSAHARLGALLYSCIHIGTSNDNLTAVDDSMRLCSVSRAISAAFFIYFICSGISILYMGPSNYVLNTELFSTDPLKTALLYFKLPFSCLFLLLLSMFFTRKAYSRYCNQLFASLFVITHAQEQTSLGRGVE